MRQTRVVNTSAVGMVTNCQAWNPLCREASFQIHQILVSRELGGAAEIAIRLAARASSDWGTQATAWLPGRGRAWERAVAAGIVVRSYDAESAHSSSKIDAAVANFALGSAVRRMGPGLLHVHAPFVYGALRYGLRLSGLPVIVHVHLDYGVEDLRWAFRHPPDLIVTCAGFMERVVRAALPAAVRDQQRIAVVRNAVDVGRYIPGDKDLAKRKIGAPIDRPLLLMLANLAPHKGQETVIRVVRELLRRGRRVECWLAGADREPGEPFRRRLLEQIERAGVRDVVKLLGFRSDGADLLRAADFLLLPSTSEGLPLTVLEAQAAKVPVLAAPTAGVPEVVRDGETGFLIPADDHVAFADRIALLLDDPDICKSTVDAAYRQCVTFHNWNAYWRGISTEYEALLNVKRDASMGRNGS